MSSEFSYVGQPELMRQAQKDEQYIYVVYTKILDLLEYLHPNILHYKNLNKYKSEIKAAATLLFYVAQTLKGQKTLGEEYTNIRQFNETDYDYHGIPVQKKRAIIFVLLTSFVPYLREKLKPIYQKKMVEGGHNTFINSLPDYDVLIQKFMKLHMAIFFIHGSYFQIPKRVTRIKNIFTRTPPNHNINYKTIGRLLIIQMIIEFFQFTRQLINRSRKSQELGEQDNQVNLTGTLNCCLCFDIAKNVSCTPCGHIFCWDCVITYVSQKQQCPQCRSVCMPNKVVRFINYN